MKLIIQIPCYNEERILSETLASVPRAIDGIDQVEVLIIDDGSTDETVAVARKGNVNHVLSFKRNQGLARAFAAGIEECLELGADIIVNTDADNQYEGEDIVKLVQPILDGRADIVIGDRQTDKMTSFSLPKKIFQKLGSALVRRLSNADVPDTVSGFRAYSREAAMHINVLTDFSYTVENLIQLGTERLRIVSVPVRTHETRRKSRLHKGIVHFMVSQMQTMIRSYAMYKALKVFTYIGFVFFIPGFVLGIRFLYFFIFVPGAATGHVQSLIFSAILVIISFILFMLGIVADLVSDNRKLIEKLIYFQRKRS